VRNLWVVDPFAKQLIVQSTFARTTFEYVRVQAQISSPISILGLGTCEWGVLEQKKAPVTYRNVLALLA
jgi:hypothetical protein